MSENVRKTLPPRQRKAIASLLESTSLSTAAEAAGVTERTLRRWRKQKAFAVAWRAAQASSVEMAVSRAAGEIGEALETLIKIHKDPEQPGSVRVQAVAAIFTQYTRLSENVDMSNRLMTLEAFVDEYEKQKAQD